MPELPDVEVFKRLIDETSLDRPIERVEIKDRQVLDGVSPQKLRSALKGRRFEATRRHGKYLFVGTDAGSPWLILHFGMTGRPVFFDDSEDPPPHARVVFHFRDGARLAFDCQRKIGRVSLTADPDRFLAEKKLGPDAFAEDFDFERFRDAVRSRRSHIKSALMTQEALAGIGNEYSDEILFQARIHPETPVRDLDDKTLRSIYRALHKVVETAVDRKVDISRFPKSFLLPHRDNDRRCPRCGSELTKLRVSGRGCYACETCQRPPR